MGQRRENVDEIPVGNIVAIEGFKNIKSGESLIESEFADSFIAFGKVKYVSTPVVTVSIEPEYLRDLDEMKSIIENLLIEDPNLNFDINEENGEFLLSGMGPLHLEVSANEIEKRGVKVDISDPRPVFKESCRHSSSLVVSKSEDGQNVLKMRIERLDEETASFLRTGSYKTIKPKNKLKEAFKEKSGLKEDEIEGFWKADQDQNVLINNSSTTLEEPYNEIIPEIIEKIHLNGPLAGEKLTEVKFTIEDLIIKKIDEETAFTELSTLFYDAIKKGLNEAEIILLEPIYHTILQLPPTYIKNTLSLVSKFSAKIKEVDQENEYQATLEILLPVRNSIKFAEEVRSITSGKAFWQNEFYSFLEVPPGESKSIISDLRFRKGLSW
jgi:elongation factor 2